MYFTSENLFRVSLFVWSAGAGEIKSNLYFATKFLQISRGGNERWLLSFGVPFGRPNYAALVDSSKGFFKTWSANILNRLQESITRFRANRKLVPRQTLIENSERDSFAFNFLVDSTNIKTIISPIYFLLIEAIGARGQSRAIGREKRRWIIQQRKNFVWQKNT